MPRPTFDLQSHSTHSDGALPPGEVVARAAADGVELLALTDHDSVAGVAAAEAAARAHGLCLLPAAELSAVSGDREDLHVLGYGIDHTDPVLRERLEDARADRGRRIAAMADRLRELGWEIDSSRLEVEGALGRPHLARAVLEHPANAARVAEEDVATAESFFPAYLVPGGQAYVARSRPTIAEAIGWIHDAGGAAVWAHPFWDVDDARVVTDLLAPFDGVEAFYITHTREQTLLLAGEAHRRGILATGSSDFHGPDHARFSRFRAFELFGAEPRLP
jgi:predicted metal-dependent phosphoesterase TrpH